ncbi:hypothetical protein BC629DRAFT_1598051 [Irpex lacteus]|nr:hypothetical protein BC629DRAFT_1598051 [Irpex lacteus]
MMMITQVLSIDSNPVFGNDTCTKCQASLEVAKFIAMAAPEEGPALAVVLDYITYHETVLFDLFKKILGAGPVYAALGNHDSYSQSQPKTHHTPSAPPLALQFSWNYDHVAALWEHEKWIPESALCGVYGQEAEWVKGDHFDH